MRKIFFIMNMNVSRSLRILVCAAAALLWHRSLPAAEAKVTTEHIANESTSPKFTFKNIPHPSKTDAATSATFTIVEGERDENGGELDVLHDGRLPTEEDEPAANFFFNAGTEGGRLLVDLKEAIDIKQINTYSWHPNTRGPQVYSLYAAEGKEDGFNAKPAKGSEPEKSGWKLLAKVDTRPKSGEGGGQHGVSIADAGGKSLGKYRYLLFAMSRTETE